MKQHIISFKKQTNKTNEKKYWKAEIKSINGLMSETHKKVCATLN